MKTPKEIVEEFADFVFAIHLMLLKNEPCDTEKEIKDWLLTTLTTRDAEIVKLVEGMKVTHAGEEGQAPIYRNGYNTALDDIIKALKENV